jgi:hypothetical protein
MLFMIWRRQFHWFRRYALQDEMSITLNGALLFVVILYVYPMKFLATVFSAVLGVTEWTTANGEKIIEGNEFPKLMTICSAGFVAIYLIFMLLHRHAFSQRAALELNPYEISETRFEVVEDSLMLCIGVLALVLARLGIPQWSGATYILIGPLQTVLGFKRAAARKLFAATAPAL